MTSDNPRSERPEAIIDEIAVGVVPAPPDGYARCPTGGRRSARRVGWARAGDTVVIAGKGHETYQIVGAEVAAVRRPGGRARVS